METINIKEKAKQAYRNQQSQDNEGGVGDSVSFIYGYIEGFKESQKEIDSLKLKIEDMESAIHIYKQALKMGGEM